MGEIKREIIRKEALQIDTQKRSWEEAVRICGELMLSLGSVEEGYISAMTDAIRELGPYIVIAPHIAFAHAASGKYVIKNDMVLVVFKEPVIFGSGNDPVHLMFGLCATEPESHVELLQQLAEAIEDDERYDELVNSDSVDELYRNINNTK